MIIQEPERLDELDDLCIGLNRSAHAYFHSVVQELPELRLTEEVVSQLITVEANRCGIQLADIVMQNCFALIGRCANVATQEGDIVTMIEEDYQYGLQLVGDNHHLFGEYVLPLFLFGVEYARLAFLEFTPEITCLADGSHREPQELNHIVRTLIGGAIQSRYYHIRQWFIQKDLGLEPVEHDGGEIIKQGRIIDER